ncbi:MAG: thioredoxin [Bacteroidota bacterium]
MHMHAESCMHGHHFLEKRYALHFVAFLKVDHPKNTNQYKEPGHVLHAPFSMDTDTFFRNLRLNSRPVIVDFWAPWCGPCRLIKPVLEKLGQEYRGRVDIWEINADEKPELLRSLNIHGIPTLLVFQQGEETLRYVGVKPAPVLRRLFESLAAGDAPAPAGLSAGNRLLRIAAGLLVLWLGWASGMNWFLIFAGTALTFTAVHDRCPVWRAITSRVKELFAKA